MTVIHTIVHPTDFSEASAEAFAHADAVEVIMEAATEWPADLIAMPTAGHRGFLDALRGATSERVLRQASCPALTVPAYT